MNRILMMIMAGCVLFSCGNDPTSAYSNGDVVSLGKLKVEESYDREMSTLVAKSENSYDNEVNVFSNNLFNKVLMGNEDKNMMISPFSASIALSMTLNGSAGATTDSMLNTLGCNGKTVAALNGYLSEVTDSLNSSSGLKVANSIWCKPTVQPLKRSFYEMVTEYYLAAILPLETADGVNAWVSDKTAGKIDKLVTDDIVAQAEMLLVNALYFKGVWSNQFDSSNTKKADFTTPIATVSVDMMKMVKSLECKFGEGYKAVKLPYNEGRFAMYLYLPDDSVSLSSFYENMSKKEDGFYTISYDFMTGSNSITYVSKESDIYSDFSEGQVTLSLPKFSYSFSSSLKESLKAMGMGIAFDPYKADFTNICSIDDLYISDVIQKTFIDVNENGTEAAAATVVVMVRTSMMVTIGEISFNRPFFYVIRDEATKTNLFMGQVVNPNN